jgi:hypothetical protein
MNEWIKKTDEWVKKTLHVYTVEYYSAIKEICTKLNGTRGCHLK